MLQVQLFLFYEIFVFNQHEHWRATVNSCDDV